MEKLYCIYDKKYHQSVFVFNADSHAAAIKQFNMFRFKKGFQLFYLKTGLCLKEVE